VRIGVVALAAVLAAGCMGPTSDGSDDAMSTSLDIVVRPQGRSGPARTWELRCPSGGTLPAAASACRRLTRLSNPFAPVPKDVACTEIYGGPQIAEVTGTFEGQRVDAIFNRTNGCEIERWDQLRFLFPVRT
jgi:hypothetical protein